MQANVIKILRNGVVIIRHALTESQNWPAIELVILKKKLKNSRFFSKFSQNLPMLNILLMNRLIWLNSLD